ncbi:MAG: hypothetical protein ACREMY_08865 [bacterium]
MTTDNVTAFPAKKKPRRRLTLGDLLAAEFRLSQSLAELRLCEATLSAAEDLGEWNTEAAAAMRVLHPTIEKLASDINRLEQIGGDLAAAQAEAPRASS